MLSFPEGYNQEEAIDSALRLGLDIHTHTTENIEKNPM